MGDLKKFSKFLAKLLRHEAISRGLDVTEEGYFDISAILSQPEAEGFTELDVQRVVDNDKKGRFKIRTTSDGTKQIKATQAHSIQLENPVAEMTPINHYSEARVVLHGTKRVNWPSIKANGLSKQRRVHIHFAAGGNVQSGFPPNCDMVIEINMESALEDGLKFYKSENGVILSPGNEEGVIPSRHFRRAYDLRTHERID